MKLSLAALVCATQLPLHARPEANSRITSEIESTTGSTGCDNPQVARDAAARCVQPGENNQHHITCWGCHWWRGDAHPICEIQCCNAKPPVSPQTCGCTPAGESYKVGYESESASKCCGTDIHRHPKWTGDLCGCGDVGSRPRHGGSANDCCSGTLDGRGKCTPADAGKTHPGMRPQDCKTGLVEGSTCAHGGPGHPVVDPSHCMSGEIDSQYNCLCVKAGVEHDNAEACCSGMHEDGTKVCACMPASWNLHHGAGARDCCSEISYGGICQCQKPGGPIKKGRAVQGCCAQHALEHDEHAHCGCAKPGANISVEKSAFCCGGFYNHYAGICRCIPNGFLVAGFVEADSCCSGHLEQDEHGGAHCAGPPPPTTTLPEPTEPPYLNITGTYNVIQQDGENYLDAYTHADTVGKEFMVVTRSKQDNDSQKWKFTFLAGSGGDGTSGLYTIQQVGNNNDQSVMRSLDAYEDDYNNIDYKVVTREGEHDTHDANTQRWIVTSTDTEGVFTIQQRSTHRYLDGYIGSHDNKVVTRGWQDGHKSQLWKFVKV